MSNFFTEVLYFILYRNVEERERKLLLHMLNKDFKHNKFREFYKINAKEMQPVFAGYILDLYKTFAPMKNAMRNAEKSLVFKEIVIDHFIDDESRDELKKLDEQYLKEKTDIVTPEQLSNEVETLISHIRNRLDARWYEHVDTLYRRICSFIWLISFDYYKLLKTFDPSIPETSFTYEPIFSGVKVEYVLDDIKDFLAIAESISNKIKWQDVFEIIKKYNESYSIPLQEWYTKLEMLNDVMSSNILTMIVRHAEKDPHWKNKKVYPQEKIAVEYIRNRFNIANDIVNDVKAKLKKENSGKLLVLIFGEEHISIIMLNYTEDANQKFVEYGLKGFTHTKALEYLETFFAVYFKTIKGILDTLVVYGEWNNRETARALALTLHEFQDCHNNLIEYDNMLSESGEYGIKIKNTLVKVSGKHHRQTLQQYLMRINDDMNNLIFDQLVSLKNVTAYLAKYISINNNTITADIKNWKVLERLFINNEYDYKNIESKIELFFKLMEYENFSVSISN